MRRNLKVLYLMHIPWGWIKQRPQYIAEHLDAAGFSVSVFHEAIYRTSHLTESSAALKTPVRVLLCLPFRRLGIVKRLNALLHKFVLFPELQSCDVVWITHPSIFDWIPRQLARNSLVVYDCMDDELRSPAVSANPREFARLYDLERRLVRRADLIFTSADTLREALIARHELPSEHVLTVNNALTRTAPSTMEVCPHLSEFLSQVRSSAVPTIMYLGTIGPWIDFDLILEVLALQPRLSFSFIGPVETDIPSHDRLLYCPPIPHSNVPVAMSAAFGLVMPFKVNDFTRSVNPVKAYEYIASGRPSFLVRYSETEKFSQYSELFTDASDLSEKLTALQLTGWDAKLSGPSLDSFAASNSWEARCHVIKEAIVEQYGADRNQWHQEK